MWRKGKIQQKLVRTVLVIGALVMLFATMTILTYEFVTFRQNTLQQASTLGQIIATNATAALAFDNPDDAMEVLSSVMAAEPIVATGLYDEEGKLFSHYPTSLSETDFPRMPQEEGYRFMDSNLIGFQPVVRGQKRLGTLYVKWDLARVYRHYMLYGAVAIVIMSVYLLSGAYALSRTLGRQVSQPILELAETASVVSQSQDYSVRAKSRTEEDEVGLLTEVFNQMLTRIELQNAAIQDSEQRVRAVLNSAMSAVIVIDGEGKIIEWNPRAETMFGWTSTEVVGSELAEKIIPVRLRDAHRAGLALFMKTGEAPALNRVLEMTALRRDGNEFPMELSIAAKQSDGVTTFCGFVTDITERNEARSKLQIQLSRMELMEEISGVLAGTSLDYSAVLSSVAQRITNAIGDACIIRMLSADKKSIPVVGIHHNDPLKLKLMQRFLTDLRQGIDEGVTGKVLKDGISVLVPVMTPDMVLPFLKPEHHSLMEQMSFNSSVVVALKVRGEVIGTLAVVRTHPDNPYTERDKDLLQEVADRTALVISNAKLFSSLESELRAHENTEALLKRSEERMNLALASAHIGTWHWDIEKNSMTWDEHLHALFGVNAAATPQTIEDAILRIHPDDRDEVNSALRRAIGNDTKYETEYRVVWPDTSTHVLASGGKVYRDKSGVPESMTGVCWDITARKAAEEELRRLNDELEQRVEARTDELKQRNTELDQRSRELEATNRELEAFTYSVSHDLRSPLRHIDAFSRMLSEQCGNELPAAGKHQLTKIRDGVQRMGRLIDDLLNLARINKQELSLKTTGLAAIVQPIVEDLQRENANRKIEWNIRELPFLECDPALMRQVFVNLLSNAAKYTRHKESAAIEVGVLDNGPSPVIFVRDNGVGFNMKYADKLFGVFQRLHRQEDFEGTGVGLAIVQRVIHKHGGRVWAEAELNKGATFYLSLGPQ
jgi:PAS domain S-box-containing protein